MCRSVPKQVEGGQEKEKKGGRRGGVERPRSYKSLMGTFKSSRSGDRPGEGGKRETYLAGALLLLTQWGWRASNKD